jgi:predicted hydrocarbon binding protein
MDELSSIIERALEDTRKYQRRLQREPSAARVTLAGVPHTLVPTRVVARDFREALDELLGADTGPLVMYRLGYLIGQAQASEFFENRGIATTDFLYRLLTGPFQLAWAGYADVDLLVWEPHLDERFAILWESDHSFSAREAADAARPTRACDLQAGYSAGWCAEATGLRLEACELACRAERVRHCRFLVTHGDRLQDRVLDPRFHQSTERYDITPARIVAPVPS